MPSFSAGCCPTEPAPQSYEPEVCGLWDPHHAVFWLSSSKEALSALATVSPNAIARVT